MLEVVQDDHGKWRVLTPDRGYLPKWFGHDACFDHKEIAVFVAECASSKQPTIAAEPEFQHPVKGKKDQLIFDKAAQERRAKIRKLRQKTMLEQAAARGIIVTKDSIHLIAKS